MMKKGVTALVALALVGCLLGLATLHRSEYSRETDPTGRYTAICSFKTYLSLLPMPMGSASDKACFVKIVDAKGQNLGEIPVPLIQLSGVEWSADGAEIQNIGEWDFKRRSCYYWSEDQKTQIYVRR
jgi:hypothetical protein